MILLLPAGDGVFAGEPQAGPSSSPRHSLYCSSKWNASVFFVRTSNRSVVRSTFRGYFLSSLTVVDFGLLRWTIDRCNLHIVLCSSVFCLLETQDMGAIIPTVPFPWGLGVKLSFRSTSLNVLIKGQFRWEVPSRPTVNYCWMTH